MKGDHLHFISKKNVLIKCISILIVCCILSSIPALAEEKSDHIVISATDIEKMNVRNMPDLLNRIPGIKAGESSVSIQGSSKVKVLLDNRPINDPASSTVIKWNQVAVSRVEKIEIHKGGGSVEYGEDSGGGVILITSKQSEDFQYTFEAYGGNLNTQSYNADCQVKVNRFNIGASLGYYNDDGFRANDDIDKIRAGLRLSYDSDSLLSLQPSINYYRENKGMAGFVGHETLRYRVSYENYSATLISKLQKLKSKTYFDYVTDENINPDVPIYFRMDIRKFGEEITSPIHLNSWGTMNIGAGMEYGEADGSLPKTVSEIKYFLFVTHKIAPEQIPVSLYTGLRGVYYTEFQNALNPEIRIKYGKKRWNIQAGFSIADNTPTFKQRFNRTTVTMPNPDLDVEKVKNYTISFFNQIAENLSLNVSAYYSRISNRFTYNRYDAVAGNKYGIPVGDVYGLTENVGVAILQGVDTTINWELNKIFTLNLSYSFIDAKDADSDMYLPSKPKHKVQTYLSIEPLENLSASITNEYVSMQYGRRNHGNPHPEYYLTSCRVEYNLGKYNVFGEVNNLFDEDYLPSGGGYPGNPMTWIAGFNYSY